MTRLERIKKAGWKVTFHMNRPGEEKKVWAEKPGNHKQEAPSVTALHRKIFGY